MTSCRHLPSRREALIGSGALFAWTQMPKLARAEGRDPRMLVIVLRGALDGLGAVAPVGDPDWIGLRGDRALVLDGRTPALPLDSFFALNPAMPNLHRLYKAQQAAIVHATATPYRERSHFDGQDVLESGLARPGAIDTGWLNRALLALASDGRVDPRGGRAIGVGPVTPLVVRGQAPVMSWAPQQLLPASDDTQARLLDLYRHTDPKLAVALEGRIRLAALGRAGGIDRRTPTAPSCRRRASRACAPIFADAAGTAARYLARPDGPRVGAMGFVGWDTHINEGAADGQLANLLGRARRQRWRRSRPTWAELLARTAVAVITEFGRTARINGTDGTDHGTGTVAFLAGGALKGGRVIADWPGLKPANLYEGRDLSRRPICAPCSRACSGPLAGRGDRARERRLSRQRRGPRHARLAGFGLTAGANALAAAPLAAGFGGPLPRLRAAIAAARPWQECRGRAARAGPRPRPSGCAASCRGRGAALPATEPPCGRFGTGRVAFCPT